MTSQGSPKQQIIQSIKEASSVLVTVSNDPSVDELSAALGLTIFLNEMEKHATAIFSGKMPPAITFLRPDKTFEDTADSLRDFIIALDKSKADHLRYKLVEDAVKIFITPYRTTITEADLEFTQGDYNVELVIALNVENKNHLDKALTAHGKILHGASIMTVTAGQVKSSLGSVDWHSGGASSVSEMLVELIGDLKTSKVKLTEQMATALLTGLVAATDRFSNDKTTPESMTAAAELMAAGANQQLIATKLAESAEEEKAKQEAEDSTSRKDGTHVLEEGESTKIVDKNKEEAEKSEKAEKPEKKEEDESGEGVLTIDHTNRGTLDEVARRTSKNQQKKAAKLAEEKLKEEEEKAKEAKDKLEKSMEKSEQDLEEDKKEDDETDTPDDSDGAGGDGGLETKLDYEPKSIEAESPENAISDVTSSSPIEKITPTLGGTLNATTEQAADDKRRELEKDRNRTILSHGGTYTGDQQATFSASPINSTNAPSDEPEKVDPMAKAPGSLQGDEPLSDKLSSENVIQPLGEVAPAETPGAPKDNELISALTEDTNALAAPLGQPQGFAPPQFPTGEQSFPAPNQAQQSGPLGGSDVNQLQADAMNQAGASAPPPPLPPLPPMPDFSTLPPLPPAPTGEQNTMPAPVQNQDLAQSPVQPATANQSQSAEFNPTQFQIPGQPN